MYLYINAHTYICSTVMSNAPFGKVNSKNGGFGELKGGRILVS